MSKTLIYLIAVFAMWMYFSFSGSANGKSEKPTVKDFDAAGSGHGGTATVSNNGLKAGSVFVRNDGNAQGSNRGTWASGGGFGSNV